MSTTPTARTVTPTQYPCRSQVYRRHLGNRARFEEMGDAAIVAEYAEAGDEARQASHLAIADLSALPRAGFKGAGAPGWLEERVVRLPGSPNRAERHEDGSLVARLSADEFLILSDLNAESTLAAKLLNDWSLDSTSGVYSLPRTSSHCWLGLTGKDASETLAKVCGVDMRTHKFAEREVAQTSLARINAIIVRSNLGATPGFFILSDVSMTEYLWDALLDAMAEFHGFPVGIAALRALQTDIRR